MVRTRNALKKQKVATVESALFNPDVVFLLAGLLDARDLCQVSLTCKTLGGNQAAYNGLSLVEDAARRLFECASDWERSCLKKYDDEGWIEVYHHLLMLRSKLTFDQLLGRDIQYGSLSSGGKPVSDSSDHSIVHNMGRSVVMGGDAFVVTAICREHIMRSGTHFAEFEFSKLDNNGGLPACSIGIVRPIDGNGVSTFPWFNLFRDELFPGMLNQRTSRWGTTSIHCCCYQLRHKSSSSTDWVSQMRHIQDHEYIIEQSATVGLLLNLDDGTLDLYENRRKLCTLCQGLSGEYCWTSNDIRPEVGVRIKRGTI